MQEKKVLILEEYQVINLLVDEESLVFNVLGEVEVEVPSKQCSSVSF